MHRLSSFSHTTIMGEAQGLLLSLITWKENWLIIISTASYAKGMLGLLGGKD